MGHSLQELRPFLLLLACLLVLDDHPSRVYLVILLPQDLLLTQLWIEKGLFHSVKMHSTFKLFFYQQMEGILTLSGQSWWTCRTLWSWISWFPIFSWPTWWPYRSLKEEVLTILFLFNFKLIIFVFKSKYNLFTLQKGGLLGFLSCLFVLSRLSVQLVPQNHFDPLDLEVQEVLEDLGLSLFLYEITFPC